MTTDEPVVGPSTRHGDGLPISAALGEGEAPGAVEARAGFLIFTVRGRPAAQGSKRHVGGGRMVESSKAVAPWREAVRSECSLAVADRGVEGAAFPIEAVFVRLSFVFPRPRVHYGQGRFTYSVKRTAPPWPRTRPDIDKLCRSTLDGLTEGGAFLDDGQVAELHARKTYSAEGFSGCRIAVGPLPGG